MPVNALITIALIGALALVLLIRRSTAGKPTSSRPGTARARRTRLGRKHREPEDVPTAPRLRPRLAMTVPVENQVTDSPDIASAQESTDADTPAPTPTLAAEPLESLWDDVETEPSPPATQTSTAPVDEADDETRLVDAPGWPSPGELVGMFSLDDLDPLPPELDPTSQPDPVDTESVDVFARMPPESTDLWRDLDDAAEDAVPSAIGATDDEPVPAAVALAWGPVETEEAALDHAEPAPAEWTSQDWSFEGRDDSATGESWGEPDVELVTPEPEASPSHFADDAWGRPETDTDDVVATDWQTQPAPVVTHPITIETAAVGATPAPIVVVLTPEMLNLDRPSRRELELEKAVRRLEKQLAALGAASPTQAKRSGAKATTNTAKRRSPQAGVAKAPFTLTAAEQRALRALAARRTAPLAARKRARIILRSARGLATKTIAAQVGVAECTVRRWQGRFAADRLAALDRDLRPGTRAGR